MKTKTTLFAWLVQHYVATYFLMVAFFLLFGLLSLDLVKVFSANLAYIAEYGKMALLDDGLWQTISLIGTSLLAVFCYLGFKLCEHALVEKAAHDVK